MSTHRITITMDPSYDNLPCYEVEHLEDDPQCAVWEPCEKCSRWERLKLGARTDWGLCDDVIYHGVEHQRIEGDWMVRTTECGLRFSTEWADYFCANHGAGVFPVDPEYMGDGMWWGSLGTDTPPGGARRVEARSTDDNIASLTVNDRNDQSEDVSHD